MRKQAVCVYVDYDETTQAEPATWAWDELLPGATAVQVIYIGDLIGAPATTAPAVPEVPEDARIASDAIERMSGVAS